MNFRLCPQFRKLLFPAGKKCLVGDNGTDPILGPPYPPINYQLFVNASDQPRLTWTVPEVDIDVTIEVHTEILTTFVCSIQNFSWPAWATGDQGYIINSRVTRSAIRYYSKIQPNVSNPPEVSPGAWEVDPTEFSLWKFDSTIGQFEQVGDSTGGFDATWSWTTMSFTLTLGTLADSSTHVFFVRSRIPSGQTVSSVEFPVTTPVTVAAPEAGDWSVETSGTIAEAVDFERLSAFPAGADGLIFQARINGSGDPFEWDGNIYEELSWTASLDFGSTLYDFQVAWTFGPARVSDYSATKTAETSAP